MKLLKLLTAVLAGMTLTIATVYTAQAGRVNHARTTKQAKKAVKKVTKKTTTPNYAYTLTRGRGHVIKLTNTGRTENMYRQRMERRKMVLHGLESTPNVDN